MYSNHLIIIENDLFKSVKPNYYLNVNIIDDTLLPENTPFSYIDEVFCNSFVDFEDPNFFEFYMSKINQNSFHNSETTIYLSEFIKQANEELKEYFKELQALYEEHGELQESYRSRVKELDKKSIDFFVKYNPLANAEDVSKKHVFSSEIYISSLRGHEKRVS